MTITYILLGIAAYLLSVAFIAGCFAASSGFQVEEDHPQWLDEIDQEPKILRRAK